MAANIFLSLQEGYTPTSIVTFDDDGEFWYLWNKLFEPLEKETGQMIELYFNAEFEGGHLKVFSKLVLSTLETLRNDSRESWQVYIGTGPELEHKQLYSTLVKSSLINKLLALQEIIKEAINKNALVLSVGADDF